MFRSALVLALIGLAGCGDGAPHAAAAPAGKADSWYDQACPVAADSLRVAFPYVSTNPPTVVELADPCAGGFESVSYLNELVGAAPSRGQYGGYQYFIHFPLKQKGFDSNQTSALAAATGVRQDQLDWQGGTPLRTTDSAPVAVGYQPPPGVWLEAFLPTGPEAGYLGFAAAAADPLNQVLNDLSAGITVQVEIGEIISGALYRYTLRLSSDQLAVTALAIE
jgi:hypothetical protein